MKKAEMEAHRAQYHARMDEARKAEQTGAHRKAVQAAVSALEHVEGMMRYERKYEQYDFSNIPAIDLILRYAPLLFDAESLQTVEQLLGSTRLIERATTDDLAASLAESKARMWENHQLWTLIERDPGTRQDELRSVLGGTQDYWRSAAEAWERMGLLEREVEGRSYRLKLSTRMDEVTPAKCSLCGRIVEAPKAMFLEPLKCAYCNASANFVLLRPERRPDMEE